MANKFLNSFKQKIKSLLYVRKVNTTAYKKLGITKNELKKFYTYTKENKNEPTFTTKLFSKDIQSFNNYFWFLHSIDELFIEEVYKCKLDNPNPLIIDCGSNIGLSIIYFKKLYLNAKIIAFEPDKNLYEKIIFNVNSFEFENVEVINKGVWTENTTLYFRNEGTLGGEITQEKNTNSIAIQTVRLKDFLNEKIDFLKIDIEGAEYVVMNDIRDELKNVENLFLEYHSNGNEQQTLHEMLHWIQLAGFKYHIKSAWENQKYPFVDKKKTGRDLQLNIFCYRQ